MEFNFEKEMIYGEKHVNIIENYDKNKYDFRNSIAECFNIDPSTLNEIHNLGYKYEVFKEFGPDTQTWYHSTFYKYLKGENGEKIQEIYDNLIKEVILPYLGLKEALVQKFPSFRIQLPNNIAVAKVHTDNSLGHPYGEVNFTYSITDMFDTNTIFIEKTTGEKDFIPMPMKANNNISFNANQNLHYNELNKTGKTRMSMDYRILPMNYIPKKETSSHSTNTKFVDGEYYKYIKI